MGRKSWRLGWDWKPAEWLFMELNLDAMPTPRVLLSEPVDEVGRRCLGLWVDSRGADPLFAVDVTLPVRWSDLLAYLAWGYRPDDPEVMPSPVSPIQAWRDAQAEEG
jgi:hypothetical protein